MSLSPVLRRLALVAAAALAPLACGGPDAAPDAQTPLADAAAPTPAAATAADTGAALLATAAGAPQLTVFKSPTCGCCHAWVEHMRENGFSVAVVDTVDLAPVKARHGVGRHLESCHTAVVDGYVIEGHVPADLVAKLLTERPEVAGLAVPGMPVGSPGMEGAYKEAYDVLAFGKDGRTTVYARR